MKKIMLLLTFCFSISFIPLTNFEVSQSYAEEDDAFLSILALNYCHLSLVKIIEYNDRVVLDEEYNNIINNINLSKIKDRELIEILKKLMDVLTQFKLDERSKEKLLKQYEKNVEGTLYSALKEGGDVNLNMSDIANIVARQASTAATAGAGAAVLSGPAAPMVAAATGAIILVQVGSAYVNYRNALAAYREAMDESVWKLESEAITRINEINKTFLETYWKLMTKYKAPDKWRLTLGQFNDYLTVLKAKDSSRRYRNLIRMENEFHLFPPYWYFRGAAAQKIGEKDDVLHCYAMYNKVRKGFFRQDKTYSSAIMLKVVETNYSDNQKDLFVDLGEIVRQDRKDWRKRLFSAYKLIEYGHFQKAKDQVQANIDNDRAVSISRKTLGDIYYLEKDKDQLVRLINKTIKDDTATNQEVLYLIGKLPAEDMVTKIKDQIINIDAEIDTHLLGRDDLILRVPQKWILDDPENLSMKLLVDEKEYESEDVKANKKRKEMTFIFEDILDAKDLMEGDTRLPLAFSLNTQTGTIDFLAEIKPITILIDKGYTDKGLDFAKSVTSKVKAKVSDSKDNYKAKEKREEKALKFVLTKIKYLDTCFQISEDNQITKCPSQ